MNIEKSYQVEDLTVITPTIDSRLTQLTRLLQFLDTHTILEQLIIIWDSAKPVPRLPHCSRLCYQVIAHDNNRGLSAARNTGVSYLNTRLGMFIDDDIIPCEDFVERIINFHNSHPGLLDVSLGKVTWRGSDLENAVTEWFESFGNWSIFSTAQAGKEMSFFSGGFTSFKKAGLQSVSFDESFVRYGCEDVEFGLRFFEKGGRQVYAPDVLGIHYKELTIDSFLDDCVGSGYSNYVFFKLWPNDYHCINTNRQALGTSIKLSDFEAMINQIRQLQHDRGNAKCISQLMHFLTLMADAEGFRKGILEDFSEINIKPETGLEKNLETILSRFPACEAAALLMSYDYPQNVLLKKVWFHHRNNWKIIQSVAHNHCVSKTDAQNLLLAIQALYEVSGKRIRSEIKITVSDLCRRFGMAEPVAFMESENEVDYNEVNNREAYSTARLYMENKEYGKVLDIVSNVLVLQPNHVGSWLLLSECVTDIRLKKLFVSRAEEYLQQRPESEKLETAKIIQKTRELNKL